MTFRCAFKTALTSSALVHMFRPERRRGIGTTDWGSAQLVAVDVHEQAVPARLHEMKDEAFLAVQKPEADNVAVEKVGERPHIEWEAVPQAFAPPCSLVRRPEYAAGNGIAGGACLP